MMYILLKWLKYTVQPEMLVGFYFHGFRGQVNSLENINSRIRFEQKEYLWKIVIAKDTIN